MPLAETRAAVSEFMRATRAEHDAVTELLDSSTPGRLPVLVTVSRGALERLQAAHEATLGAVAGMDRLLGLDRLDVPR